jgi:hypothetical protein
MQLTTEPTPPTPTREKSRKHQFENWKHLFAAAPLDAIVATTERTPGQAEPHQVPVYDQFRASRQFQN